MSDESLTARLRKAAEHVRKKQPKVSALLEEAASELDAHDVRTLAAVSRSRHALARDLLTRASHFTTILEDEMETCEDEVAVVGQDIDGDNE